MINLNLMDEEWERDYIDHTRRIVRALIFDEDNNFYFNRVKRDDDFGSGVFIETIGGGVKKDESDIDAIKREIKEELRASVEVICQIGKVNDYYNLIHRNNINIYFLCKVISFGQKSLTRYEKINLYMSTLKISLEEALLEYKKSTDNKLGRILYRRETPIIEYIINNKY